MDNLSDVFTCCRGLALEKVTDRKKNAEKFRQLLCKTSVIKALDKYTDSKSAGTGDGQLTWDNVFKAVSQYVLIETQHLQKSKEQASAASQTRKDKAKKEVSDLFKFVIRQADKRGPRLKCTLVLNHINEILQDDYMCQSYGIDYTNILLKNILSVRKYWIEITSESWHNLIGLYVKMYSTQNVGIDKTLLSRVISTLISGATIQCDLRPKRLLNFFTEVFKNVRQEKSLAVVENLLTALNTFIKNIAANSRTQICKLGESVFINMLYIWENRPTPMLKNELIEFLSKQMHVHHPGGSKRDTLGAFAVDWNIWMSHLRKLYEVMYGDFQQMGGRNRFSAGSRDAALPSNYVELTAEVCNQLFQSSEHVIEVTQVSLTDTQERPGAKKRRLESGWTAIRDIITSAGQSVHITPWLQLITRVMEKFPQSLSADEVHPYLNCLSSLIAESKKTEISKYLLMCTRTFADNWDIIKDCNRNEELCLPVWKRIWTSTLRCVSLHHASAQGYQLLKAMLEADIVHPDRDIWSLFLPSISPPTQEAVEFLLSVLQKYNMPEQFQPSVLTSANYSNGQYPLRLQLIDWIMPSSEGFSASSLSNMSSDINPNDAAHVLVLLTIKNQSSIKIKSMGYPVCSLVTDLENTYLQTSHDFPVQNKFLICKQTKRNLNEILHLPILMAYVEKMLTEEISMLLDVTEIQMKHVDSAVYKTCLISKIVYWMLKLEVMDCETLFKLEIVNLLKTLYKKLGALMEILQKDSSQPFVNTLKTLQTILEIDSSGDKASIQAARLVRCLFPAKIIDQLLGMASNKLSKQSSVINTRSDIEHIKLSSKHKPNVSRSLIDDDDMDLEFDQPVARDQGEEEDLDDDFGDSQNSDDTNMDAFLSPLCVSVLSDVQTIRLNAIKTLCMWCGYDRPEMKQLLPMETNVDPGFIRTKIEQLIDEEELDTNKAFDLQMLNVIVSCLISSSHRVGDCDLENILDAIRRVAKHQRKDQNVSCLCLDLLSSIVKYLDEDEMASKTIQDCRELAVHLLSAFWKLQDQFSTKVRIATAKCMMAFIEVDPKNQWTVLSTEEDEHSAISNEFIHTMCDLSHDVRMFASQSVTRLFVSGIEQPVSVNRHQQNQLFDKIYVIINETMDIKSKQGSLSVERAQDEKNNRTASALTTVGNIMCSSVVCENRAIFALCQLARECEIDIKQVQNVIQKVSSQLGYRNGHHYMSYHLPYVLNQWLGLNYPVSEFPYQLAFCESIQTFYRDSHQIIIPQLIMTKNIRDSKEVVTVMAQPWDVVLKQCIPKTVVYMLPLFAVAGNPDMATDDTLKKKLAHATACYDLLTREATKEVVEKTIVASLDDIVVNILMCLYDPEEEFIKTGSIRNTDPEPNPPCYNTYMIKSTLDYLTRSFSGSARTLVDVMSKNQDSIQKILLDLAIKLASEHRLHEKRRIFLMYQLFVKLLLREFSQQLGGSWAYVLRETIYRLVHFGNDVVKLHKSGMKDCGYSENIVCMSLQLLKDICVVGIETCSEEFSKYLSFITGNLVEIVQTETENIVNEGNQLLQLLIIDNYVSLRQAIVNLDPFPADEKFQHLSDLHQRLKYADGSFTLAKDIIHFIKSTDSMCSVRKEGLQYLAQKLQGNRAELSKLTSQDTERENKGQICQLICKLVHMYHGTSEEEAVQISKCLGEIGAVDLEQNALPRVDNSIDNIVKSFNGIQQNYCRIFHMLNQFLVDDNMSVVEAASGVLKSLLNTKTGFEFANFYKEIIGDKNHLFHYLHPFKPRKKFQSDKQESVCVEDFQKIADVETLWTPADCNHDSWIQRLTCALINAGVQDEILCRLKPICSIKTKFCEMVLPLLIHDLLLQCKPIHRDILSSHINRFFSVHCDQDNSVSSSAMSLSSKENSSVCRNKTSIRTMLNVVQYLRQQDRPKEGRRQITAWDNNFWLDLDFLHIAKAALYCSAHFSTVLFAEIWCDIQRQSRDYSDNSQKGTGFSQSFSQATVIDSLGSSSTSTINVQDLLLEAYQLIGDPDGLYGCGAGRLADTSSRVKSYEHENKWEKAVITYDIEMCHSSATQYELLQALQNFGSTHLLDKYLGTLYVTGQQEVPVHIRDLQFQAAWKAGQWNLETNSRLEQTLGFNEAVYSALIAIKDGHHSLAEKNVTTARMLAMKKLSVSSMESARCLYPILADLQCVAQIDDVLNFNILKKEGYNDLTSRWNSPDSITENDFTFLEPSLSIRCSILKMLQIKHHDTSLNVCLQHQLLKLAQLSRESGRHQISERAIFSLKEMETSDLKLQIPKLIEEANLYWSRQEQNTAKHLMKNLITKLERLQDENIDAARFYPQVLSIYGSWLADTRSENPNVIMEDYLEKTVGLLESLEEQGDVALDAYLSLARFADNQYQNIVNYMKSPTYEAKQALMKKAKADIETLEQLGDTSSDRYYKILSRQSDIDKAEVEAMNEDKTKYLQKAVENYLMCLKYGDKHDLRIFRLISLWFSNASIPSVNSLIEKSVIMLKSYKFLPLMYQLAARMTTSPLTDQGHTFQTTLNNIIERAAIDHPHHTLMCVLALAHAKKDVEKPATTSTKRSKLTKFTSDPNKDEGRIEAAKLLILRLKEKKSSVANIVVDLEKLCMAYIQLANLNVSQYKKETRPIQLQSGLLITKIKDLPNVALPTVDIRVDPTCKYAEIIHVQGFSATFKLAGGVNLPKIISCIGSDGKARRQLVKGRDDLRQDAVMQQVFGMVNNLLQKNTETRKRQLHVRQYKVVPLSQMSGLLEWCEGTIPIGEYLVASSPGDESPGAHCRYRPDDYTAIDCRRHMTGVHTSPDAMKKFKVFLAICKKFLPVFRHFFMEKFQDAAVWYEARLAYTKSVATNSIVGYILGLGDRHVQNILIDCNTAELVHIDLGVAFEQGKILPTPETVPFRLTRDIVDGMGVSGVEGVFRRCCEKTMEVMHNNQEALLTILEVLLYDPLYAWCMSPAKVYALQHRRDRNDPDASELNATKDILEFSETNEPNENRESVNKLAERVLLRLHQKLQGIEDGVQMSVSGQVNLLIQEAKDPKNLAKLFPGWQPYI